MIDIFYKKIAFTLLLLGVYYSGISQSPIPKLQDSLNKTTSTSKKADICFTISTWYSDRLKIDSGLFFANKIKEFSESAEYEAGIGKFYLATSFALRYRGRNAEAEENALKAIEIFTRQKEILFLGRSYWQLAAINYAANKIIESRKNFWTSIHYLVLAKDQGGCFRAYFLLARTYIKTAETDSAAYYYVKALEMAEQLNDDKRISEAACEVGECYLSQGELEKANKYLSYGLKKRTTLNDKVSVRSSLDHYSTSLILLHDFSRADSIIKEFELLNVALNDAWGKITLNRIRGLFEYEQKSYHKALKYMYQANNNIGGSNMPDNDVKQVVFLLGKTEFETQEYDSAIIHLQTAGKLARELRHMFDETEANLLLSKAFEKKGKPDSALYYFRNYSLLKDSVLTVQKQKNIIEITTRYETGKKEQEIKILQKEGEANSYLLQLKDEQLEKQLLGDKQKSQQLTLISKQNEINKLDASQKTLGLDNERKENEKNQAKLKLLEKEAAYQKLLASKQDQQKINLFIGAVVVLLLSGYGLYRYIRSKKLQNEQLVLSERLRISRELHDELGSTLSGIAMYSHLTREQIKADKPAEVEKSLNNMQQTAGTMINKLKDIVWLINPEKDSLQKLTERLEEYAEEMAMIKNIEVKINALAKRTVLNLPVESRRDIYLFCKEAINNAFKYSNANLIELDIKEHDNKKIEFLIHDNGKGFDTGTVKKGNGLQNMQQRASDINGIFLLRSAPGQGTTISLTCKIT